MNYDFKIKLLIGSDTTPPTIPTNVTATPISTTEIDLTWSASTDNYILSGYQVFRDSVQIATTTLLSYSDTGLATSTLYSYEITAFDASGNVSTSSAPVATTTLGYTAPTSTPTTTTSTTGGKNNPLEPIDTIIGNFNIDTTLSSAEVTFDTNVFTKALYRWGRTSVYESGYISGDSFVKNHRTLITDLAPGTTYELEIVLTRRLSGEPLTKRVQFTTDEASDQTPPPNVMHLSANLLATSEVELSWQNPPVDDFAYVRIVASDIWYPADPLNGWFVYQGSGKQFVDKKLLVDGRRYYTVFTYDENGNRSSGAVVVLSSDGTTGCHTNLIVIWLIFQSIASFHLTT